MILLDKFIITSIYTHCVIVDLIYILTLDPLVLNMSNRQTYVQKGMSWIFLMSFIVFNYDDKYTEESYQCQLAW